MLYVVHAYNKRLLVLALHLKGAAFLELLTSCGMAHRNVTPSTDTGPIVNRPAFFAGSTIQSSEEQLAHGVR